MNDGGSSVRAGNDLIEIGGGNEASCSHGDTDPVGDADIGASQLRGGDDVVRPGVGDDVVIARGDGDGRDGDDRLSCKGSRKGVRIDLRDEEAGRAARPRATP